MELTLELKSIKDEILGRIASGDGKVAELQRQVDAIDLAMKGRGGSGGEPEFKSVGLQFVESEEYKVAASSRFTARKILASIENPFAGRKSVITTSSGLTSGTSGVLMPMRLPEVTGLGQQRLRIRDLMTVRPMTQGSAFDFVRQTTRTNNASPQVESSPKGESTYAWDTVSDTVKTVAHFCNVSRQAIEDVPWLRSVLDSELMYGLLLKLENEILAGDGLGQHFNGIITQATAYAGTYDVSGDTRLDKLRHAKLEARMAGLDSFAPDGIVLNPVDMQRIELLKTEEGGANKGLYILGNPRTGGTIKFVWDLPVVESDSITVGTFLVGAFGTAAELVEREDATVELSREHDSNFTKNLCTLLCEMRAGLAVRKPGAFIRGTF